jgi:hypothetical protein
MPMRKNLPIIPRESSDYRYSESVAEAVKWLGDRYLLAKPIRCLADHSEASSCGQRLIEGRSKARR